MEFAATPAVARRIRRGLPPTIQESYEAALVRIAGAPEGPLPDRREVWRRIFPAISNHRHVDLRDGWRLCYAVHSRKGQAKLIVLLFLGTHKEYDRLYGFHSA